MIGLYDFNCDAFVKSVYLACNSSHYCLILHNAVFNFRFYFFHLEVLHFEDCYHDATVSQVDVARYHDAIVSQVDVARYIDDIVNQVYFGNVDRRGSLYKMWLVK